MPAPVCRGTQWHLDVGLIAAILLNSSGVSMQLVLLLSNPRSLLLIFPVSQSRPGPLHHVDRQGFGSLSCSDFTNPQLGLRWVVLGCSVVKEAASLPRVRANFC